jgi:flagellar basal-body rod protein FlgB
VTEIGRYDTTTVLERALPVLEASQRILANNIANANTPGFRPSHVSFRESLRSALEGVSSGVPLIATHPRHISPGYAAPSIVFERDTFEPGRNDMSTFDVDREMVALTKNSGRFEVLSGILTKRYQQLREVLRIT